MSDSLAAQVEVARASIAEKLILRHLMELYNYDFSEFDKTWNLIKRIPMSLVCSAMTISITTGQTRAAELASQNLQLLRLTNQIIQAVSYICETKHARSIQSRYQLTRFFYT